MKKKFVVIFAVIAVIGIMFALAACKDGGDEKTFEGSDDTGREYGQVYALTQESADGWFRVPAESFSESTMGKFMVDNTRKDYVTVIKSGEDYSLIYHATSDDMNNVRLVTDGQDVAAQADTTGTVYNYRFDNLTWEDISGEISVKVYVATMMKRDTQFTIQLDFTRATLVPADSFAEN